MEKKLITTTWEDLRIGDIFPETKAEVTELWPWENRPCYLLITEKGETIVSAEHLFSVKTDVSFDNYEKTKASKAQTNKLEINWIAAEDAYYHFMNNGKSIAPGTFGSVEIRQYKNGEPQKCRCITTTSGTFDINGVLFGQTSRGTHTLDGMKEIVSNMLDSGIQEDWISKHLFISKEAIGRYKQLSGLSSAFKDAEAFSTDIWDPDRIRTDERKKNADLNRLARQYVRQWRKLANSEGGNFDIPEDINIIPAAQNLGFDTNNPLIMPSKVDTATGEVIETAIINVEE